MTLRCLIVDDSTEFLVAARRLLVQEGLDVVGVASSSAEAVALARELQPDVTLVDANLGPEDGFALAHDLVGPAGPGGAVIMISTHAQDEYAELIAASPAAGFLSKSALAADAIVRLAGARIDPGRQQ